MNLTPAERAAMVRDLEDLAGSTQPANSPPKPKPAPL